MLFTRTANGEVLSGEGNPLSALEFGAFLHKSMRKKIRRRGRVDRFMRHVRLFGEASHTWSFIPKVTDIDDDWVTVHAWHSSGVFRLYCLGPQADAAVQRVNSLLGKLPSWWNSPYNRCQHPYKMKMRREHWLRAKRTRLAKKRAALKLKQEVAKSRNRETKKNFIPAPVSLVRNELLTPQFRKSRIFWQEAICATVATFDIRRHWKYSARELAARELWSSLERSGYRFAQYKRRSFCLRFDLFDGVWRGDLTPVKVTCTKDNTRQEYRRMRKHFRHILLGIPTERRLVRADLLRIPDVAA